MQKRDNDLFNHIVNEGLIMKKLRGFDQAINLMAKAGLPNSVISRVLSQPNKLRDSDWH